MTGAAAPPAGDAVLGCYLAEIAAALPGPARARRDILAELGAGLADAADAHRAAGLDPAAAARAAVTEFGRPDVVARGFRAELAATQARRTALTLMASGPVIGGLWTAAVLASHIGAHPATPWQWPGMPGPARLVVHLALFAYVAAIGGALLTVATTGRLTRWFTARPPASAALAVIGTVGIDLVLLTLLVTQAASTPGKLALLPVAAAAAASLTRLALTTRAARGCLSRAACS